MKTILLFLVLTLSIIAQDGANLLLFDDADTFNPLAYDVANLVALYDGDLELTTSAWGDQSVNNYDLTLENEPTINTGALNGHTTVTFNGIDERGYKANPPGLTQQMTWYLVVKSITFTNNDRIISSHANSNMSIWQGGGSPNLQLRAGSNLQNGQLAVESWGVITGVFNGASSQLRINLNDAVVGNAGTNASTGIMIADDPLLDYNANVEFAYIIIREGVDDLATQNLFIAYLIGRFGL